MTKDYFILSYHAREKLIRCIYSILYKVSIFYHALIIDQGIIIEKKLSYDSHMLKKMSVENKIIK